MYSDDDHDRAIDRILRDIENLPPRIYPDDSPRWPGLVAALLAALAIVALMLAV